MSVAGYIGGDSGELRMPQDGMDCEGLQVVGAVLEGKKSVEGGLKGEAAAVDKRRGEFYRSVADYDPVLRSHCRL